MNSCILMVEIVQDPQLRYTSDGQVPIAEMLVQFPSLRAGDPPETLKVVAWRNLASEVQQQFRQGDRVVVEGRLNLNTIERPEGFREKRAELTAQRIHSLGRTDDSQASPAPAPAATPQPVGIGAADSPPANAPAPAESPSPAPASGDAPMQDDIPF